MLKKTLTAISIIVSIIVGFFAIDAHYVTSDELAAQKVKTAQALSAVVLEMQISMEKTEIRNLNTEIMSARRWLSKHPGDQIMIADLNDLRERRTAADKRLKELEKKRKIVE